MTMIKIEPFDGIVEDVAGKYACRVVGIATDEAVNHKFVVYELLPAGEKVYPLLVDYVISTAKPEVAW